MVAVTKKSELAMIPEGTEIVWKDLDGILTIATLVHCYCGKKVVANCATITLPKVWNDKFKNAEKININEMEGDTETETCDC